MFSALIALLFWTARVRSSVINGRQSATAVPPGFAPGVKWQIEINEPIDNRNGVQLNGAKVLDLDLFHASKAPGFIDSLRASNPDLTVLCYFNLGAVQTTDCDWKNFTNSYGNPYPGYPQERYVDIRNATIVNKLKWRIDLAQSVGCDGIDPDNIDTYDDAETTGFPITQANMVAFLTDIASYTHGKMTGRNLPMMIGQKNAWELTTRVNGFMDFAVLENCLDVVPDPESDSGRFCGNYSVYINNQKPVFDIEYPPQLEDTRKPASCNTTFTSTNSIYCSTTDSNNFSRILKLNGDDNGLNGCTEYCGQASFVLTTQSSTAANSCCFPDFNTSCPS